MKVLIVGNGYVAKRCNHAWDFAVHDPRKIYSVNDVLEMINEHRPDAIVNAAGVTGRPNVDWCEDNQMQTIVGNTKLPILLAEACQASNVYLLHIGSGCIFYGDSTHEDKKWREADMGNPEPVYSRTKWAADLILSTLPHVGIARIRMPIDSIPSPRNLIDKLAKYPKIIDVENSVTIIEDMLVVFQKLLEKKAEGIFHVTNPGVLKHKEIMALYQELVDSNHSNEWISNDDLVKQGLATKGRSNNFLASENLEKIGITMRPVHEAIRFTMQEYARHKKDGTHWEELLSC